MKILSFVMAFLVGFFSYPFSYLGNDNQFEVSTDEFTQQTVMINGKINKIDMNLTVKENGMVEITDLLNVEINKPIYGWFNYYGISYTSDSYMKCEISYYTGVKQKTEQFFLEPAEDGCFYSFIDNFLSGTKANMLVSISFEPINSEKSMFSLKGISCFNRSIPSKQIYTENEKMKIGIDLLWGGALCYLEDLDSNVEVVDCDGKICVDSNASERYGVKSINNHVNLINRNYTGRLVQQSYYGIGDSESYSAEYYGENLWSYNPVQGGNQYNENSKIVDLQIEDNYIYIKCQPLDWAKSKEYITPSYMEAWYKIEDNTVHVSCKFIDFSGYEPTVRTQEIPAFYCVEPLNNYVYYSGDKPWTNDTLTYKKDLIFWPDAGYPNFASSECWSAFMGEFDDSFGIGLYVKDENNFLAGVYERGKTGGKEPAEEGPTSYIAVVKDFEFKSFSPFEYDYYIATGNINEIRTAFSSLK